MSGYERPEWDSLISKLIEARGADEVLPLAEALAVATRAELGQETAATLEFVSFSDLHAVTPPEPPWLLPGYIARGAVTLLAGKPKAGKSTLACGLVEAIDADAPSFLSRTIAGGPVVYVSEEGAGTLAPKLPKSTRSVALTRDAAFPKPPWPELLAAAVVKADEIGAVLLVIDSFSFWASFREGQEKDSGSTQRAMDALGEASKAGLAVLLVHHQRKAGGEDGDAVRGSGAIFGAVDALVEVERIGEEAAPEQRRLVAVTRWLGTPPVLVVEWNGKGWRTVGEASSRGDAAVLGYRDRILGAMTTEAPGATEDELAELVGVNRRKLSKPLRELFGEGGVERTGGGRKGDPYRYHQKLPPNAPPAAGENQAPKCSPPPIGGSREGTISPLPLGGQRGERGETLEDALLDPDRAEAIRAAVDGEWVDADRDPDAEIVRPGDPEPDWSLPVVLDCTGSSS